MSVGLGRLHSCVRQGTEAKCWGSNEDGQLGNVAAGSFTNNPQRVSGLSNVREMLTGGNHSCAVHTGGQMSCWGSNGAGNLGDGTLTSRSSPVSVLGVGGVVAAAAGERHTCALLVAPTETGGQVSCWGDDSMGQLGLGDLVRTDRNAGGFIVEGVNNFTQISAGGFTTCGVSSASVLCWGSNQFGQLGFAGLTSSLSSLAVLVRHLPNATKVAVGGDHACAIAGGRAYCWGSNSRGQLGDGSMGGFRGDAELVSGLPLLPPIEIFAGPNHSCVVLSDGSARCWGANDQGQLGTGGTVDTAVPLPVLR